MAATFGKLEEFDTATGEDCGSIHWKNAIIIEGNTKWAILIITMGGKAYKLMHHLILPAKPSDK